MRHWNLRKVHTNRALDLFAEDLYGNWYEIAACAAGRRGAAISTIRVEHMYGLMDITDRRSETTIKGLLCSARVDDLWYAVGSALWTAHTLMVNARPFAIIGMAGPKLGYCPNSALVVAVPVAVKSKNPYVDVNVDYHLINIDRIIRDFDYRKWVPKPVKSWEEDK